MNICRIGLVCYLVMMAGFLGGCSTAAGLAAASAESQQRPEITAYLSRQTPARVHAAAAQAMATFGAITLSDRDSGIVQGKKGNWQMSVAIIASGQGGRIELSTRYLSSKQMDLNSKSSLLAEYTSLLEKSLQEKLNRPQG